MFGDTRFYWWWTFFLFICSAACFFIRTLTSKRFFFRWFFFFFFVQNNKIYRKKNEINKMWIYRARNVFFFLVQRIRTREIKILVKNRCFSRFFTALVFIRLKNCVFICEEMDAGESQATRSEDANKKKQ